MTRVAAGTVPTRPPARAYEPVFVPHPGDVLRLLTALSIPAAWIVSGPLSSLVMALAAGGTWVLRYYARSRSEDLAGQAVLFLGGAFSVLGTYRTIAWLDVVVHVSMLAVLTTMLGNMLVHHGMLPAAGTRRQDCGLLLSVTALGVLFAVLWEIGEWAGHSFITPEVGVGYADTIGDLAAGLLGSLLAAVWFHRAAGPGSRP